MYKKVLKLNIDKTYVFIIKKRTRMHYFAQNIYQSLFFTVSDKTFINRRKNINQ